MVKTKLKKVNNSSRFFSTYKPPIPYYKTPRGYIIKDNPNPGYSRSPRKPPPMTWRDYLPNDIDLDIYKNQCNSSIQASLRIGVWRLPTFEFLQRVKECRLPTTELEDYEIQCEVSPECEDGEKAIYIWWKVFSIEYSDGLHIDNKEAAIWEQFEQSSTINKVEFPKNEFAETPRGQRRIYAKVFYTNTYTYQSNYDYSNDVFRDEIYINQYTQDDEQLFITQSQLGLGTRRQSNRSSAGIAYRTYSTFEKEAEVSYRRIYKEPSNNANYPRITTSTNREGISGRTETPYRTLTSEPVGFYYDALGFKVIEYKLNESKNLDINEEVWTALTFCENGDIFANECYPNAPKPPPPPKKMRCCPDNSDLLKEILKIVKQNKKAIGYDDLPANLPQSFIVEDGKNAGQEDKPNLVQIIGWLSERLDETIGQFELEIEIQDSDATKEGDQPVTIKLPNIAESLGEITMMLLSILYDTDLSVNLNSKLLAEVGSSKQIAFKNNQAIDTIVDYLGYGIKQVREDLPMTFTPGAEEFEDLLKPKTIKVPVDELDDTRTLPTILQELLHAAAIIRAVHWRQVDPKKDIAKQIIENIDYEDDFINKMSDDG